MEIRDLEVEEVIQDLLDQLVMEQLDLQGPKVTLVVVLDVLDLLDL